MKERSWGECKTHGCICVVYKEAHVHFLLKQVQELERLVLAKGGEE